MNKLLIFVVVILLVVMILQYAEINQQSRSNARLKKQLEATSEYLNKIKESYKELSESDYKRSLHKAETDKKVQGLLEDYIKEQAETNNQTSENKFIPDLIPITGEYRISQNFTANHPALDYAASLGTEICASGKGEVVSVYYDKYFGNVIVVDHQNGYSTLYAHLATVLVKNGSLVKKGEIIGLVGNTGNSTAPHLHFEVIKNGKNINPIEILKKRET